ncbi:phosphonoacetate hydrolase [Sphingobacterium allocomposti]|jgi:protein PhnA|uniref:Phosphonoacetate hydrolase n=1 Tax=Sphingobacterium allocomposti TaxID=415956 RepID=A0A5S5DNY8_9SPHI|nr:alkylphosphonate utilization protein [Sphingobacterium composti Yoo et al. 2007 non Ten et al. 2007]TYP96532.1 phosphonoacetate hydrolase [Sphingobacterium composti Yoo et al. 2007 non Ten et al. 2007]HLS94653.1 PhnA domain-containing protein [Sphingobacterium sp.]
MTTIESLLIERSHNTCELCKTAQNLSVYAVPPTEQQTADNSILACKTCIDQIEKQEQLDAAHWTTLSETMWSDHAAVQVVAWRMLSRLRQESWAADNLDMLYLDDDVLEWAKKTGDHEQDATVQFHQDSNGTRLYDGDTVVLIKTLDVKGSSVTAKLGTVVKNIRLVQDNVAQVEGKIEGQTIVILTKYLRKG